MKRIAKTISVKTVATLSIIGCAVMSSPFALAEDDIWYGGLSVGQSRAKIDDTRIANGLLGSGLTTTSMVDDDRNTAYKIFAGYKFNQNFAIEGGYFNLGQFGYTATTIPAGTLQGKIKLSGLNLDGVGMLPLTENFSVLGRLGMNYARAHDKFSNTGAVPVPTNQSPGKSVLSYKYGLGVQYALNEYVGLRGEWERHRVNDAVHSNGNINFYSVGLVVMMGKEKEAPAPVVEAAPERVAPAPMLVIVPIPAKTERYCSILDIQFEINENEIQREVKEKLSVLGTFMKKYPNTTAVIEGHSDNVGTPEANMKLSQQRAESVVNYMVDGLKIARSRLKAVGYGETRPIASNDTEIGKRLNRRIDAVVACATDIEGLKVVPARLTMALEMEFDNNKADIKPEYDDELHKVANFLNANPQITATVEAHTSNLVGNETQAMALDIAQRRGQNVLKYLVEKYGVSRSQLSVAAFGEERRFAYNTSLEGQQENRRINIIFNYPTK